MDRDQQSELKQAVGSSFDDLADLDQADPFIARAISKPRLIWDPAVHRYYSHVCSFFLLRYRQFAKDELEKVQESLTRARARSVYIYTLFGHFDVLVRVWAEPHVMEGIRRQIHEMADQRLVHEAQEVQIDDVRLILGGARPNARVSDVEKATLDISLVAESCMGGRGITTPQVRSAAMRLINQRLLHAVLLPRGGSSFRFATVLQLDAGASNHVTCEGLVDSIQRYNGKENPESAISRGAIYAGFGYGSFIITGFVQTYGALAAFSGHLREFLAINRHVMRAETYLTASEQSYEADVVDPREVSATADDYRIGKLIADVEGRPGDAVQLANLVAPHPAVLNVRSKFRELEPSLGQTPFRKYLALYFSARINNDAERLDDMLRCLSRIEFQMAKLWEKTWQMQQDPGLAQLKKIADNEKIPLEEAKQPTFKSLSRVAARYRSAFRFDHLSEILGVNWDSVFPIDALVVYRNHSAHGRVTGEATFLDQHWDKIGTLVSPMAELYNRLHAGANRPIERTMQSEST